MERSSRARDPAISRALVHLGTTELHSGMPKITTHYPDDLAAAIDEAVRAGLAENRNQFLVAAARSALATNRRRQMHRELEAYQASPEGQAEYAAFVEGRTGQVLPSFDDDLELPEAWANR